ncbi:MAG: recombinase family protein, partial [Roseburia sp.]|nr:recombinase family protein [Roseburia sp.]
LLLSFDKIYDKMTEDEKKLTLTYLIKDIQIYPNDEKVAMPLKSITLNFPVFRDNREVNHILWNKDGSVETLVVLSHKKPDGHINVKVEFGEEEGQVSLKEVAKRAEARKPKAKVTYKIIQDYIEKAYGFKVHTAYIAEVKRDLGLPMYDAPNVVEELKRPRTHPTPKMIEAIKATFKHFEIF